MLASRLHKSRQLVLRPSSALAPHRPMSSAKMNINRDGTITITPEKPTAAVVFMHGLGDTAQGWSDAMAELAKDLPHVKFILPTASNKPVTLNMGMRMPSWYDIASLTKTEGDENKGIEDSVKLVTDLIEQEVSAGIPHSRIVLGGFSQGGAMSYFTGYQMKKALAGVLVLSGYIPKMQAFAVSPEAKSVPALICHGDSDPVVRFQWGQMSMEKLQSAGVDLDFRVYNGMEHSACYEELQDIKSWLKKVLPKQA